jgi:zinc finger protein 185
MALPVTESAEPSAAKQAAPKVSPVEQQADFAPPQPRMLQAPEPQPTAAQNNAEAASTASELSNASPQSAEVFVAASQPVPVAEMIALPATSDKNSLSAPVPTTAKAAANVPIVPERQPVPPPSSVPATTGIPADVVAEAPQPIAALKVQIVASEIAPVFQAQMINVRPQPMHSVMPSTKPSPHHPAPVAEGKTDEPFQPAPVKAWSNAEITAVKVAQPLATATATATTATKMNPEETLAVSQSDSVQEALQAKPTTSTNTRPAENANPSDGKSSAETVPTAESKTNETAPTISSPVTAQPVAIPVAQTTNAMPAPETPSNPAAAAAPMPAASVHAPEPTTTTTPKLVESLTNSATPRTPQDPSTPEPPSAPGISTAQISGNAAQSEVHLALQADKLGNIELHARVTGEQVGAAIVVDKKEAHAALAVELPALREALSEQNLRVDHVWLTQSSLHSTAGDAGNPAADQRQRPASSNNPNANSSEPAPQLVITGATLESTGIFDDQGRLSVHA